MKTIVELTREAGGFEPTPAFLERLVELARADEREIVMNQPLTKEMWQRFEDEIRADERMSFYGQDKPAECAEGCPPNQICDYCQVVAPVKAMILAEREACAKLVEPSEEHRRDASWGYIGGEEGVSMLDDLAAEIRARGENT
jgi:hypothetical protein